MTTINIEDLKPYEKNAKVHSPAQIKLIANSIEAFGFDSPIIVDKDNVIIAGHGRYEGALMLGLDKVPVIRKENLTPDQVKAYRLADNKIAESDWDLGLAIGDLRELDQDLFALTGFDKSIFDEVDDPSDDDKYTKKIIPPVYEPRGEKPSISTLYNDEKTKKALEKIEGLDLDEEKKNFLRNACYRLTIFSFKDIADYYAHSEPVMKDIMEDLALIIIDYNKAIELGFVKVSESIFDTEETEIV